MGDRPKRYQSPGTTARALCVKPKWKRLYGRKWDAYAKAFLSRAENALCKRCLGKSPPVEESAMVVDHIVPYRGDPVLFWDPDNHQGLCKSCHDSKTATEDGGFGNQVTRRA